ncbi:MAG: hypothetical protein RLZZ15_3877 [Verrucomicrobiota bacterium]|jgi:hypothetical protein
MTPSPDPRENLEHALHRALRALPPRRAPHTLSVRVLAELARRAALPWWRQSYAHWPAAMRAAFFLLSAAAAALVVAGSVALFRGADATVASAALAYQPALEFVASLAGSAAAIYEAIPRLWLAGAFALVVAAYAALVGVGAVAYRAFAVRR